MYGLGSLGLAWFCNTICSGLRLVVITVFGAVLVVYVVTLVYVRVNTFSEKSVTSLSFFINFVMSLFL